MGVLLGGSLVCCVVGLWCSILGFGVESNRMGRIFNKGVGFIVGRGVIFHFLI